MSSYNAARDKFAAIGVDLESVLETLGQIQISIHCWQGDDVGGFERAGALLGGGLAVTGNYPGKARTPVELRQDFEKAHSLVPGMHRINLHAMYGEFAGRVERDAIEPSHFQSWIDWCKAIGIGFDFNPTCFSHQLAEDGFTLSHEDREVRGFWIEHCRRCREIAAHASSELDQDSVVNTWIPDGMKDTPADRRSPRERLTESLDAIFETSYDRVRDSVEPKLFGIGSESYVVGSHEYYLGYAATRGKMLCLDAGHYHPTESIADKVSSCLLFLDEVLLHVSRGVRWDSDHVVVLDDDLKAITREIVANDYLDRVHIGLDYFDASINRVAAWVIGVRAVQKALLCAHLEPSDRLKTLESNKDFTGRLALQERVKSMPWGDVWDEFCTRAGAPQEDEWQEEIRRYETTVLANR